MSYSRSVSTRHFQWPEARFPGGPLSQTPHRFDTEHCLHSVRQRASPPSEHFAALCTLQQDYELQVSCAAFWSVAAWLVCHATAVHSLAELVNIDAPAVLGSVTRHSRAIACTNGGTFQSVSAASTDEVPSSALKICCSEGSTVWWEGLDEAGEVCAEFGGEADDLSAFPRCRARLFPSV